MAEQPSRGNMPVTEKENDLLKATFKGNDYLLKAMRSLLMGFDVSEADKSLIKGTFSNPELFSAFRKKLYPTLSNDNPIGQLTDFWMGTEEQIFGADPVKIKQSINVKVLLSEMYKKAINLLVNPDGERVDVSYSPVMLETDPLATQLIARNLYLRSIETALYYTKLAADQETETPKQIAERKKKDSAK